MTTDLTDHFCIATQGNITILYDAQSGDRLRVYRTRAEARAEADRLNARDDIVSGAVWPEFTGGEPW